MDKYYLFRKRFNKQIFISLSRSNSHDLNLETLLKSSSSSYRRDSKEDMSGSSQTLHIHSRTYRCQNTPHRCKESENKQQLTFTLSPFSNLLFRDPPVGSLKIIWITFYPCGSFKNWALLFQINSCLLCFYYLFNLEAYLLSFHSSSICLQISFCSSIIEQFGFFLSSFNCSFLFCLCSFFSSSCFYIWYRSLHFWIAVFRTWIIVYGLFSINFYIIIVLLLLPKKRWSSSFHHSSSMQLQEVL